MDCSSAVAVEVAEGRVAGEEVVDCCAGVVGGCSVGGILPGWNGESAGIAVCFDEVAASWMFLEV